jgi:hypothetical protein
MIEMRQIRRLGGADPRRLAVGIALAGALVLAAPITPLSPSARAAAPASVGQMPLSNGGGGYGYGYGVSYPYSGLEYPYPGAYAYPSQIQPPTSVPAGYGYATLPSAENVTAAYAASGAIAAPSTYAVSGGYCSTPDGGQIWVPAGASPAGMGC